MKSTKRSRTGRRPKTWVNTQPLSQDQLNEEIRKRAQKLYENRGGTPGHEIEDWLEAEKQVKEEAHLV